MTTAPGAGVLEPVLVIGTGLVGTSVGLALGAVGIQVHLRDLDQAALAVAASRGAGQVGGLGAGGRTEAGDPVRLVVVAVPPGRVPEVAAEALTTHPDAVVTDVGSVKSAPLRALSVLVGGDDLARYVGGHPMSGSEQSGPWAASAELFSGRAWAVTPHRRSAPAAVAAVEALARACGSAVVTMSPDEHDLAVARVSHLPHLLSVLTAAQLVTAPPDHLSLSGQGLRDVTRVAAGDPGLWTQIIAANAPALRTLLRGVRDDLDVLLAGLDAPAGDGIGAILTRAVDGTRRIPAKHGGPARAEAVVVVSVPDRPGELARLFADAGQSGVNVEDLRIDHDPGRPVGLVELVVQTDAADRLVEALAARGWSAHR
ncbi:MAG: prephenate dehydrogenase [Nocardioidaceae bacterium]|nr:prephenate dehydrogenase [Nocardioidaceae bacterium]